MPQPGVPDNFERGLGQRTGAGEGREPPGAKRGGASIPGGRAEQAGCNPILRNGIPASVYAGLQG